MIVLDKISENVIRPKESRVKEILLEAGFDESTVNKFMTVYFLLGVFSKNGDLHIEFIFSKKFDDEFTDNVESFFRGMFGTFTKTFFRKVNHEEIILRKFLRKQPESKRFSVISREIEKKNFKAPKFITQTLLLDGEKETKQILGQKFSTVQRQLLPDEPKTFMLPQPAESVRQIEAPKIIVDNQLLLNNDEKILPPVKKTRKSSKIVEPSKKIADIRAAEKNSSQQVVIVGEIGTGDRNGVNMREFKSGKFCIVTFAVIDDTDGITCKKHFKSKEKAQLFKDKLKDGALIKVKGKAEFDTYSNDIIVSIDNYELLEPEPPRQDNAEVKRVELHVHTTMSAMDAIISPEKLITTAADWNWSAVAITDHGVIQAFPFAADTAAKLSKQGKHIKIIYGMEGYMTTHEGQKYPYHVIILAKNKIGLDNLYRLVSISQLKYFYRRPRIPKEILKTFRAGLIIGSACSQGELIDGIINEKSADELEEIAAFYDYLEIQPIHNNDYLIRSENFPDYKTDEDLQRINIRVAEIAKKIGKPLVATCDAHFLNADDAIYRAIMMSGKGFADADIQPPIFLRTTQEMLEEFKYLDDDVAYKAVVENPNKIAAQIEELKPIPDGLYSPQMPGADEEIRLTSYERAKKMYGDPLPKIVAARLEQELKPIIAHGFSALYLIAQKLVKKSNDDGYLVGSRGSVGSSFVAAMTGITEVNPLPPHYRCPKCQYSEFFTKGEVSCGYDLESKICPVCGHSLIKDGHDIPFAVFLGFDGDKVPDIDLNFSGEYQATAHKYTEILFGRHNVYRAGTISTIADKTAYGFTRKYYNERGVDTKEKSGAFIDKMAKGFTGVKRTTGQHPAGIMVVPRDMDIHYFTPIQHPAEDKESSTITTHFDYHSISSRLVKLDILGHDDPTVIKMLEKLTGIDPLTIPLDDKPTLKLFSSTEPINLTEKQIGTKSGTFGIPEFRTGFTRNMLDDTTPQCFSDLVRISGFSHGTDVWLGNAQDLIKAGICTLRDAISARDDIMMYLIHNGVDALKSFKIMENVRKGKGIKADVVEELKAANIPDWYIDACQKIKYLFPRAHATAYVMMAYRIAYCKVHYPMAYYAAYFSIRADEFDADEIVKGADYIKSQIDELEKLSQQRKLEVKENGKLAVLQVAYEMNLRNIGVEHVDLYKSDAEKFILHESTLLPPLSALTGVGTVAAQNIVKARDELKGAKFSSIEDLSRRANINKTAVAALQSHGCLEGMPESNQISLFDF